MCGCNQSTPSTTCSNCCNNTDPCVTQPCGCEFEVDAACVRYTGETLPCADITKGDTLEAALQAINEKLCAFSGTYVTATVEAPGVNCENGGTLISILDSESDAVLSTTFVCNGVNGNTVEVVAEAPSDETCPNGGVAINVYDNAGVLTSTEYVCIPSCECTIYDSGWIDINTYDAGKGYGLAALQNVPLPKIRVVDKIVFIEGYIVVPLSDDAVNGTTLVTSGNVYPSTHRALVRVYEGTLGGFTTNVAGSLTSTSPIIPSALRPTLSHNFKSLQFALRPVLSASETFDLTYNTILPSLILNTNGKLIFSTIKDTYDSASVISGEALTTEIQNNPLLELVTRAEAGDTVQDYSAYKTSFTAAVDQRITTDGLAVFPSAIDATDAKQLGGFYIDITMSYPLGETVTEQQIIDAITEIQA